MSETQRRGELIQATLDCIVEFGLPGATVRRITQKAGVTQGLVRHYFSTKDHLIQAAYRSVLAVLTDKAEGTDGDPETRLRDFIVVNLTEPVSNNRNLALWAAFISQVGVDPALSAIHREGYLAFRDALERLLGEFLASRGVDAAPPRRRSLAIAINGLMNGLWLESRLAGDLFARGELVSLALASVEALTGVPFTDKDAARGAA